MAGGDAVPRITGGWAGRRGGAGGGIAAGGAACVGVCDGLGGRTMGGRAGEIGTGVVNRSRGD
jgi:hypothetical protein